MKHNLLSIFAALIPFIWTYPVFSLDNSASISSPAPKNTFIQADESNIPVLKIGEKLNYKPKSAIIYQLDETPLGKREPLIFVHGLRAEYHPTFRWDKVIKRFNSSPEFCDRFKIYLLRYDTTGSLKVVTPQFKQVLMDLQQTTHHQPFTIVALSLGGNLIEEAMLDQQVNNAIKLVLTMGTPFHGSPLFSADWYKYSLYKNLAFPWTRIDHNIDYKVYFSLNPNLLTELEWDNADGYIPSPGRFRSLLPFGPKGNLTVARDGNERLLRMNFESRSDKSKFITYAGYLPNPYLKPSPRRQFETTILSPYTMLFTKFPAHLAFEHSVLKMLNREISRMIPNNNAELKPNNWPHVYGLNDGITPINSAVFLSSSVLKNNPIASESDIHQLKGNTTVKTARIFRNVDHLTFIDARMPVGTSPVVRDELNPEDGNKHIFDWILSDIMHEAPTTSANAETAVSKIVN